MSEWTSLTKGEIVADDEMNCKQKGPKPTPDSDISNSKEVIKFEDAVGRNFSLPFQLVHKWIIIQDKEDMINKMFPNPDTFHYPISQGYYNIIVKLRGLLMLTPIRRSRADDILTRMDAISLCGCYRINYQFVRYRVSDTPNRL
ncbi:hypothetical protein EV127DRAFT_413678 [Xylaria flabelliformis]|nr:hypothetical protein EV127DRAFT_413678 [Xylaria flabelliformis]